MKKVFVLCLMLLIVATQAHPREEDSIVQVFTIRAGDVEEVAEVFRGLKSEEGTITVHKASNKIVVVDGPENIRQMQMVRQQVDVKPKMVRVDVLVVEMSDWLINRLGLSRGRAVISPESFVKYPYMINGSERSSITSELIAMSESGKPAIINVSQERLFGGTVIRKEGLVEIAPTTRRMAGTSIEVVPVVNGDGTITISLYPVLDEYMEDDIVYGRALLTRMTVNPGDTVFIGGFSAVRNQAREDGLAFKGGTGWGVFSTKEEDTTTSLFLTVNIVK